MKSTPEILIQDIRHLMVPIMAAFEGLELKELTDDKEENFALASAITLHMLRHMSEHNGTNYIPTAIDFVAKVKFPARMQGEGEILTTPEIDQVVIEQYVRDVSESAAKAALGIQSHVNEYQDAHLILSMLHFSMYILSSTFNIATSRNVISKLLEDFQTKG